MGGETFFHARSLASNFHMTTGAGVTAHGSLSNSKKVEKWGSHTLNANLQNLKLGNQCIKVGVQE